MRTIASAALLGVLVASTPALAARPKLAPEQQLAKLLGNRVPGKPVNCLSVRQTSDSQVINGTAIVYRVGGTYYVNRPTNAKALDDDDILVVKLHQTQLCSLDTIELHDRYTRFYKGFVGLNQFVPYTLPGKG